MKRVIHHIRSKVRPPTRNEARHVAIGGIVTTGVVIGACIALAKIPALQLDKPKQLPSAKVSTAAPPTTGAIARHVAAQTSADAPVRFCLDKPKRQPPCAGIGRK